MMDGNIPGIHDYCAFLLAGIALNLVPGQDTLYIIGRSLAQGRAAGVVSVLGIGSGCLVHITAAAFGLYAVLALCPPAFTLITILGGLYLIWLGIGIWVQRNRPRAGVVLPDTAENRWQIYREGFFTNLLNPKVALFFIAFLPSFIVPGSGYGAVPFLILGLTFFATGTIWCLIVALSAAAFADALRKNTGIQGAFDLFASLLFITLGAGILLFHG